MVLVYLLLVINLQSWIDPLIVVMALPFAIGGVIWMLFLTGTHLSVPALMGALMSLGLATANSILVVTFANQRMEAGDDLATATVSAGLPASARAHHSRRHDFGHDPHGLWRGRGR